MSPPSWPPPLLAEDVDQVWSLNDPHIADADRVVEVADLPDVKNPETANPHGCCRA